MFEGTRMEEVQIGAEKDWGIQEEKPEIRTLAPIPLLSHDLP